MIRVRTGEILFDGSYRVSILRQASFARDRVDCKHLEMKEHEEPAMGSMIRNIRCSKFRN